MLPFLRSKIISFRLIFVVFIIASLTSELASANPADVLDNEEDGDPEAGNRISPRHVPPNTCCVTYNVKEYHVHDKDKAKSTRWNANAEAVRRERLKWLRRVEKLQVII